jgi:hypothetical protein
VRVTAPMEAVKLLLRAIEKWVDNKYAKLI